MAAKPKACGCGCGLNKDQVRPAENPKTAETTKASN